MRQGGTTHRGTYNSVVIDSRITVKRRCAVISTPRVADSSTRNIPQLAEVARRWRTLRGRQSIVASERAARRGRGVSWWTPDRINALYTLVYTPSGVMGGKKDADLEPVQTERSVSLSLLLAHKRCRDQSLSLSLCLLVSRFPLLLVSFSFYLFLFCFPSAQPKGSLRVSFLRATIHFANNKGRALITLSA